MSKEAFKKRVFQEIEQRGQSLFSGQYVRDIFSIKTVSVSRYPASDSRNELQDFAEENNLCFAHNPLTDSYFIYPVRQDLEKVGEDPA